MSNLFDCSGSGISKAYHIGTYTYEHKNNSGTFELDIKDMTTSIGIDYRELDSSNFLISLDSSVIESRSIFDNGTLMISVSGIPKNLFKSYDPTTGILEIYNNNQLRIYLNSDTNVLYTGYTTSTYSIYLILESIDVS